MKKLIFNYNNKAFTDSTIIAEGAGVEHKAVIQLIKNHYNDVSEFGKVAFQMIPSPNSTTGRKIKSLPIERTTSNFCDITYEKY